MNRFPSSLALAALVAASLAAGAGCSILGDEADVTVQASDAALTDKGSDKLFTLTLSDAPKAYDAEKILVRASADGVADTTISVAPACSASLKLAPVFSAGIYPFVGKFAKVTAKVRVQDPAVTRHQGELLTFDIQYNPFRVWVIRHMKIDVIRRDNWET